jgi:cell division protein ZapA (FtsZ GTPase activity inhibitor)
MRKVFLGLVVLALISVSCKDETKEKIEEANEAVGAEIEEKMDTASVQIEKAMDTLQSKTGDVLEKGAEKLDKAAEDMKEAAHK